MSDAFRQMFGKCSLNEARKALLKCAFWENSGNRVQEVLPSCISDTFSSHGAMLELAHLCVFDWGEREGGVAG